MKQKLVPFTGCATALVTPFTEDGLNLDAFGALIDFQLAGGVAGLVVCGTTGEPSTMSADEKSAALAFAVGRVKGRVPVIAGVGGNDTRRVVADSRAAADLGADALLAVTPYYNKTTQAGLVAHFTAVAEATPLPIILYNVPSRTGLNLAPAALNILADHPRVAAVKEASGNIEQITEIFRLCHDRLAIYSGNDDHIVPFLGLGGEGVISVLANVCPKDTQDLVTAFHRGDLAQARALQFKLNPLVQALFAEVNPIPVKTALGLMGIAAGPLRLPLVPMQDATLARLKAEMKQLYLL
ncbi:MAG: 4-hydroxy-tetrahydrodipicolinate synthase [Oscillospiraceae bacterium]|jgi:4-hydroxy-tetrahydrodipicolinate synthase|nr:4-hydroxy-tetrahydrodipicolinate synthase [Oscillospiraceae bacterium]